MEEKITQKKKVLVFGVFDRLHAGHHFFLEEAAKEGELLTIVVTPDHAVNILKNRAPKESAELRIKNLKQYFPKAVILEGDKTPGAWNILESEKPDVIALGYDQENLRSALLSYYKGRGLAPSLVTITPHRGEELHTSLLHP
jgi:cytidyltransferase-like protein